MLISHLALRRLIGYLGALLPFLLLACNYFIVHTNVLNDPRWVNPSCSGPFRDAGIFKSSISHYYYTAAGELFTGVLIAVSIFLFCYRGHPLRSGEFPLSDRLVSNIAAVAALGIVVFPVDNAKGCIPDNMRTYLAADFTGHLHFIMAALFFVALSVMSVLNFRRTGDVRSFGKNPEHRLYLFCGLGMLTALVLIFIYVKWMEGIYPALDSLHPVFILETLALVFFAVSWLRKGKFSFRSGR